MAIETGYLYSNENLTGNTIVDVNGSGENIVDKYGGAARTRGGYIQSADIYFSCTGNAKVSAAIYISNNNNIDDNDTRLAKAGEETYVAGEKQNIHLTINPPVRYEAGQYLIARINNGSSYAKITLNGMSFTADVDDSGSEGGNGGGSGGGEKKVTGSVTYDPNGGTINSGTPITITYSVKAENTNILSVDLWGKETNTDDESYFKSSSNGIGSFTITPINNGDDEKFTYDIDVFDTDEKGYNIDGDEKTFTVRGPAYQLPKVTNVSFSGSSINKEFLLLNDNYEANYSVNWTKLTNIKNNSVSGYNIKINENLIGNDNITPTGNNYSYSVGSKVYNLNGEKISHQIIALASRGNPTSAYNSTSDPFYLYTLYAKPQQKIYNYDNPTFSSGSATIKWDPIEILAHDEVKEKFTIKYQISYQYSSDKKIWKNGTGEENKWSILNTEFLTTPEYFINDIITLVPTGEILNGKFIRFKITNQILYNNSEIFQISTKTEEDTEDNFLIFAGNKPKSLNFIKLNYTTKKNKNLESVYEIINDKYDWREDSNCKYLTKDTKLTIGFNENTLEGYDEQGVRINWSKGKDSGVAIITTNFGVNELIIDLSNTDIFPEKFWDTTNKLTLSIASIVKKILTQASETEEEESFIVTELNNYTYKGEDIQIAKLPTMTSLGEISPISKIIPVNFKEGNQEPIANNSEDLIIAGIKGTHSQNIDIYGYKAYANMCLNNIWLDKYQLVKDKIFTASEGEIITEEVGLFIPIWEKKDGFGDTIQIDNKVDFKLNILQKNTHLNNLFISHGLENQTIQNYGEKFNISYHIHAIDEYGQESENYYEYNFYYDCRKPSYFDHRPIIFSSNIQELLSPETINPYNEEINIRPICVFNKDSLTIKFYPGIKPKLQESDTNNEIYYYSENEKKYYLKYESIDPNYYLLYKFIRTPEGKIELSKDSENSKNPITLDPSNANINYLTKQKETIDNNIEVSYYLYDLSFNLNKQDIDEIEYFQIIPVYYDEEGSRISRIYYYENNSNNFNIGQDENTNAIFWNSRLSSPKVQVTGIERIGITKDNFGLTLPKLKLYVTDWGTTHQFVDDEKLDKNKLIEFNRLTDLTYSINYYEEIINKDGETDKIRARKYIEIENETLNNILINYNLSLEDFNKLNKTLYTDSDLEDILNGKIKCELIPTLERKYLVDSQQMMDYNTLAAEYKDYYNNFRAMQDALQGEYKTEYEGVEGTTKLPVVTSGTTLYINLPSPIKGTEESSTNFFAYLTIIGKVKRVKASNNTISFYDDTLQLIDYSIYISQNKKTFMIQQGKLGINQPELNEVEESLYIVDKKQTSATNDSYPNILGLELDRVFNKNNNITGAFIGFYDDSISNKGERILMGSLGMGVELDENEKATYTPLVIYNEEAKGASIKVKLAPEAGAGIKIEGDYNNVISHKNSVEALEEISLAKISYDSEGHITGKSEVDGEELRKISRIAYDVSSPEEEYFEYPLGEPQEGDIYIWVQSE